MAKTSKNTSPDKAPPEEALIIDAEIQPRAVYPEEQAVEPYFRASMYAEQQKFDIGTKSRQLILGEDIDRLDDIPYGLDLTDSQERAKDAIQKLLHETGYKGDGQIPLNSADFKIYDSYLPYLSISWTDYYQAYGLEPAGDGRYHGAQAKQARDALESLTEMRWMSYQKPSGKYDKDGKPLYDFIRVKKPLIHLQFGDSYHDITEDDIQKILSGKELTEEKENRRITRLLVLPSPILIDDIDRYYLLKPSGLHDEIKALYPGKRISTVNSQFITLLLLVDIADWKIGKETLAYKLNMDTWIETRQKSRIDKRIQEALKTAKELDFLLDYEEDATGLLTLRLNPERCSRVRAKLARKKSVKEKKIVKDKETG